MKILIAGSSEDCNDTFKQRCIDIASLVSQEHELVLGSDRNNTADYFVMNELIKLNKKAKITIFYHDSKEQPFSNNKSLKESRNLNVVYKKLKGNWNVARTPQISYSDSIIIIGGSTKTEEIIELAECLDKTVIPIPNVGGVSDAHWHEFKKINKQYNNQLENIENWNKSKSIKSILELSNVYSSKSEYKHIGYKMLIPMVLITILTSILWILLLSKYINFNSTIAIALMAFLSSLIGANLYGAFNLIETKMLDSKEIFILRPIIGISITFIFIVMYMIGALSINGNIDVISNIKNEDFNRIALSLSALGVFSGLMIEQAMRFVKQKLLVYSKGQNGE